MYNFIHLCLQAGLNAGDVGIITPYLGQVKLLKTLLTQELKEEGKSVEVNTVDQYQGRDKIAIICTFVRCGKTDDKVSVYFLVVTYRASATLPFPSSISSHAISDKTPSVFHPVTFPPTLTPRPHPSSPFPPTHSAVYFIYNLSNLINQIISSSLLHP